MRDFALRNNKKIHQIEHSLLFKQGPDYLNSRLLRKQHKKRTSLIKKDFKKDPKSLLDLKSSEETKELISKHFDPVTITDSPHPEPVNVNKDFMTVVKLSLFGNSAKIN